MRINCILRNFLFEILITTALSTVILLVFLLYGNLVKHDEYFLQALSIAPDIFVKLLLYLVPYALSFALPFGFSLSLLLCYGKWSSTNQILALRSLGISMFEWGSPGILLSILISVITSLVFLQFGPINRAKFDKEKSSIVWTNIHSMLEKEDEIELELPIQFISDEENFFSSFTDKKIHKVTLSVGSAKANIWHNIRITLQNANNEIIQIVNGEKAFVSLDDAKTKLRMNLKNVDFQSTQDGTSENFFVTFEEWDKPIVLPLNSSKRSFNINRVGLSDLLKVVKMNNAKSFEAKIIINKSLALGTSPFFLSLLLIPLSISKVRSEHMTNLSIGIFISIFYYFTITLFEDFAEKLKWIEILWIPNVFVLIIGSYLIISFEKK